MTATVVTAIIVRQVSRPRTIRSIGASIGSYYLKRIQCAAVDVIVDAAVVDVVVDDAVDVDAVVVAVIFVVAVAVVGNNRMVVARLWYVNLYVPMLMCCYVAILLCCCVVKLIIRRCATMSLCCYAERLLLIF